MKTFRVVDYTDLSKSAYISAANSDAAVRKFFQMNKIKESPVRSVKQTHQRKFDSRFYTIRVNEETGDTKYGHSIGYNREGYEFDCCFCREVKEETIKNLTWIEATPYFAKKDEDES